MIPLHCRLGWLAQSYPDLPAISDAAGTIGFGDAAALAGRMAAALQHAGLEPGDRFVVLTGNRRESMLAYVAASATGTVCTQLNTRLAANELAEIAADAAPRLALCDAEGAAKLLDAGLGIPVIGLDGAADGVAGFAEWLAAADGIAAPDHDAAMAAPLFQLYTSGTTGRPSGIVLSQGAWAAQTEQFRLTQPYGPGQGVLVVTPLFHIAAAITGFAGLLAGAHIVLPPRFDPAQTLDAFISGEIAGTMMVPAMIDLIVNEAEQRGLTRVEGVRRICYGASPITEGLLRRALDLFGCDFIQGYGLTETAGVTTILMPGDHRAALAARPELLRSAGRSVVGGQLRIAREDGSEAAPGELGEIQIRGPHLFSGYFNNPDRTAQAWTADGWFRSGDAGTCDADGYVYIVDRIKDLIITGGENVFPQEVERVLVQHPAVAEATVFGVRDARWGESVAAALVMKRGQPFDEADMRAFADARLARFKTPRLYRVMDALPRNATGKVLRKILSDACGSDAPPPAQANQVPRAARPEPTGTTRQQFAQRGERG